MKVDWVMAGSGLLVEGEVSDALDWMRAEGITVDLIVTDPPWGRGDLRIGGRIIAADDPDGDEIWMHFTRAWTRQVAHLLSESAVFAVFVHSYLADAMESVLDDALYPTSLVRIAWEREYALDGVRGTEDNALFVAQRSPGAPELEDRWPATYCGTELLDDIGHGYYRTRAICDLEGLVGRHRSFGAKPVKLFERVIERWLPHEGGLVLDPFAGSGPLARAATNRGHHWVGIERPEEAAFLRAVLDRVGLTYERVII